MKSSPVFAAKQPAFFINMLQYSIMASGKGKTKYGNTRHTRRYHLLDGIRGITLISMILYHAAWDAVYLLGAAWPWYQGTAAHVWQHSICWTFILLSGFCIPFSVHCWKRGLTVFAGGLLVTAVTCLLLPEDRIIFGVLTFLGSAMLIMAAFEKNLFALIPPLPGLILNTLLFLVTRPVNEGAIGILERPVVKLPALWYHGYAATYLGFTDPSFYSTDYFSLIPWLFLFLCGYFLCRLVQPWMKAHSGLFGVRIPVVDWMGKHSLLIYLLHQPVLYMFTLLVLALRGGL